MRKLFILAAVLFLSSSCSSLKELTKTTGTSRKYLSERLWAVNNFQSDYNGFRLRHAMSPLIYKDYLIQANSVDGITVYHKKDGQILWSKKVKGGVEGGATVSQKTLFFGSGGGRFYAVDVLNGRLKWTFPIKFESLSAPHVSDGVVYVTAGDNTLYAINAKSGQQKWSYGRRINSNFSVRGGGEAVSDQKNLYIGFSDGFLASIRKSDGRLMWERALNFNRRFKDIDASPVLDGKTLYVSSYDDSFYAINKKNGQTIWQTKGIGGSAKALVDDEKVYVSSSNNQVHALDKASGKIIWSHQTKGLPSSPKLLQRTLIVGEKKGELKFLSPLTGEAFASFWPGRGVSSDPTVDEAHSIIYFMSVDANIFAIKNRWVKKTDLWPWEK